MFERSRLKKATARLTSDAIMRSIPESHYEQMIIIWRSQKAFPNPTQLPWNKERAAAALLHAAHGDGFIKEEQLNELAKEAILWADEWMRKTNELAQRLGLGATYAN